MYKTPGHTGIGVSPYPIVSKLNSTPEEIIRRGVDAVKYTKICRRCEFL